MMISNMKLNFGVENVIKELRQKSNKSSFIPNSKDAGFVPRYL